jgi:hypothetical protein
MKALKVIGWVLVGLVAATAMGLAFGFPVMWLWNWLMPSIFGLRAITFWQAVGLLILSHVLFKSHIPGHKHHDKRHHQKWDTFANRVKTAVGHRNDSDTPPPDA